MNGTVGQVSPVGVQHTQSRHPNFGSLVSTINRGDIEGAKGALDALIELAPKTPGWSRKGTFEAINEALEAADLEAARKALRELQQARLARVENECKKVTGTSGGLPPGSTISILV